MIDDAERKIKRAEAMRAEGMTWRAVARELGVSVPWLFYRMNPKFRTHANRPRRRSFKFERDKQSFQVARDAARLQAQIPDDTRDFTQRVLGDPIFERSALFKKMQEAANA